MSLIPKYAQGLFFSLFFSQKKRRCLSGVFLKILKVSYTFCIDYPIFVSYIKLCCVKQNICLEHNFPSYRMKAESEELSFKLLSVLLHWMWGALWKESLFIAYAKREREICTEVFKVLALSPQETKELMHSDIVWRGLNDGCKKRIRNLSHSCSELHYFLLSKWKK